MTPLRGYQLEGARGIYDFNGRALLADEMGLGKSIQALYYCHKMRHQRPIIIVCPASLKWNWEREASHHMGMSSEILQGRRPPKRSLTNATRPVVIINYEILKYWVDYLVALNPLVLIFDESHYISNKDSQRYKALEELCDRANIPHRIALSGTPLTNRPSELWTTLRILRPDIFRSFNAYAFKHCLPRFVRGQWEYKGAVDLDALHAKLKRFVMIRRRKCDVLKELPPKTRKIIPVKLSRAAREEYEHARLDFLEWLRAISPAKALRAARAQAVVQVGYLLRLVAKLKRFYVKEWIENFLAESDEKLIVFSGHTKLIDWLCRHFPDISVRIDGKVRGEKRMASVDRFQNDRRCRIAFCNPKAAGVGLNMTKASHVLYTDFPWTPGTLKQGEDRSHRFGQTKKVFIWFLAAIDTIEERLMTLLINKQSVLDRVLDGIDGGKDFDVFAELLKGEFKLAA